MTLKFTDLSKRLQEAKDDTVVFAFGRFNPMTIGHAKLMKKVESEGSKAKDHFVFASHSVDNKKNPLDPKFKRRILAKAFPRNNIKISSKQTPTALHIASMLYSQGYKNLVMVAGSDRVTEFQALLDKYNNTKGRHGEYKFDTIKVVSAGERDADAEGDSGASGTKMREYAARGDFDNFKKYSPENLSDREVKSVFNAVRKKMPKLDEELFGPVDQVREDFLLGNVFQVGDQVFDLNEKKQYEIIEHGPNFVYCKGEDGDVYTKWLSDIGDINEVRQDKDIKDKEGTQPAKYFKGLAKSTKSKRDAHFKKGAEKDDDDPSAYKPAPGDADAKTKPSKHTKKFKQMFGELQTDEEDNPRIPRKKGQPAGSDKHSDLYTDENPKGTIHGLKFATVEDAKASVAKIEKSGKKHAHKIQAAIAMEQRARVMGKTGPADVYRAYINKMKKKTKEMNEKAPDTADAMKRYKAGKAGFTDIAHLKAKGLIARSDGTKRKSDKYEEVNEDLGHYPGMASGAKSKNKDDWVAGDPDADYTVQGFNGSNAGAVLDALNKQVENERGLTLKSFIDRQEITERKLTPAEKEKMKKYEKDIDKKDFIDRYGKEEGPSIYYATITKMAKGESLWDNIRKKRERIKRGSGEKMRKVGDKGAPTPAQMQRAKDATEAYEIGKDYADHTKRVTPGQSVGPQEIDEFLEEEFFVEVEMPLQNYDGVDDKIEADLEKMIDGYDSIEDLADLYPDLDKDGDHDDDDETLQISKDAEEMGVIDDNYEYVDEVLTPAQRFKRAQAMRRVKGKIARARKIALKRPSSPEKLQKKAQRHARNLLRKKFIKGRNYADLSFAEKAAIEKRLQGKGSLINRIAMRVKPKLKQLEQKRLKSQNQAKAKSEEVSESMLIEANIYRIGSEMYYETFNDWKKTIDRTNLDYFDKELLETDIGSFALYEGQHVPLDCPMIEEEKQPELNKPKAGGPKKYYVYVKDPKSGNIKKVSWGDTTGLKIKLNDKEARKSFSARHNCPAKKDKTKPGYWACRMPYYAKQLGLSGGGNFFW